MTARTRLKHALKGSDTARVEGLSAVSGVPIATIKRACRGETICADAYLRLCAALDLDPVTLMKRLGQPPGELHWASLGIATHAKRMTLGNWPLRRAATQAKLPFATLARVERGEIVSIETVLTVCAYLGRHPTEFVLPAHARETATGTKVAA
jgi:transcriptional regulator with XRE-family HTH domain